MSNPQSQFHIPESELIWTAVRSQGAGGQNVNKVASAIHLRFSIKCSSLPLHIKHRLLQFSDSRINKDGIIIIKAQQFRTQEKNREDALARLLKLIEMASVPVKQRIATKSTRASKERRLNQKQNRSQIKSFRGKVEF